MPTASTRCRSRSLPGRSRRRTTSPAASRMPTAPGRSGGTPSACRSSGDRNHATISRETTGSARRLRLRRGPQRAGGAADGVCRPLRRGAGVGRCPAVPGGEPRHPLRVGCLRLLDGVGELRRRADRAVIGTMPPYPEKLQEVLDAFAFVEDRNERAALLMEYADRFDEVPESVAARPFPEENHVTRCESDAYV